MTDVITGANQPLLGEEDLRQGMEMLFYAYREFTAEADAILAELGFGRAHHRVVYFVGRHPGINVTELLSILRITKQSLARVLGELVRQDYIRQTTAAHDRRLRLLALTEKGVELEQRLSRTQCQRVAAAYGNAGAAAVEGFRKVMTSMMCEDDRAKFLNRTRRTLKAFPAVSSAS